jgi:hypothetical protein
MFLVLGSCRVLVTMNSSKFNCLNTWKEIGKRDLNSKCIIGRGWSINEHFEMLQLILGFKKCSEYVGDEYSYEHIKYNINYINNVFSDIKGIIIEVSSLKFFLDSSNNIIHNITIENRNNITSKKLNEEEMMFYLIELIKLLPNKKIYFVNHFLHQEIPERLLINKCLNKIKNDNVIIITPSDLFNDKPYDFIANDNIHYKNNETIHLIAKYIDNIIEKTAF